MTDISSDIQGIKNKAIESIKKAQTTEELDKTRLQFLSRKSKFNQILKSIKTLDSQTRVSIGKLANETKNIISDELNTKRNLLAKQELDKSIIQDWMDITVPGSKMQQGHLHPISQILNRVEEIFAKMGFEVYLPYEIDDDYHNFESVNIPKEHPARDAWDTFWTEDGNVLITHTSSMQNRIIKSNTPPIRAIVPGKCFRNESTDARHEHTFYQVEGIYVDKGITLEDMLGTLKVFFESFFEKDIQVKFMPDFFPFVEPGGQMALSCVLCDMKGCRVCKNTGWLEVLGCGMIHPNVLSEAGLDPEIYTGFAWGFGLERLIMLKHNIEDIRLFHTGDIRFIKQF